jgi:2-dehydropantoate 2-reductase
MSEQAWSPIAVVGAGAVGSYFGGLLARAGAAVTLIGRAAHVEAIGRDGLLFESGGAQERIKVQATTDIGAVRNARLVLLCVKSFDTEEAAKLMKPHLAPDAVVLSLQNGVDNPERIRRHVANPVIPMLIYIGASSPEPGHVRHTGGSKLVTGAMRPADRAAVEGIATLLTRAGLSVTISEDIEAELWVKLVLNCAYNAVSALSGSNYGLMVATPEVRRIMQDTVDEVSAVARAKGVRMPDNVAEINFALADAMPQQRSSTAQDIEKGRRTEIEHLNGYVVREGEALGIATPVNRTLGALMKVLEQTRMASPG